MPLVKRVLHLAHFGGQVGHSDDLVDELLFVVVTGDEQVQLARLVLDQVQQLFEIDLALGHGADGFVERPSLRREGGFLFIAVLAEERAAALPPIRLRRRECGWDLAER